MAFRIAKIALLIGFLSGFSGCDSTEIDPFKNEDRYYTLYGFLDQTKNFVQGSTHTVRVIPITRRAETISTPSDPQAFIDARVFSVDTVSGQEIEWDRELALLDDNQYGHVFRASIFIREGRTYRLEVRRSDGIVTSAETTVPLLSSTPLQRSTPILSPDSSQVIQEISLPGIRSLWDLSVIYRLGDANCIAASTVRIPYDQPEPSAEEGIRFMVDITGDTAVRPGDAGANGFLCAMGIEARVPDNQWLIPADERAVDSLAFSNAQSNVINGFGFFGSLGLLQKDWPIEPALDELLRQ